MRYSIEPSYRKYVHGQGFMSFAKNIGNKYGRKIFDKSIDVGKNMSNKYGRKMLDKSILQKRRMLIPPEKRQQIIKDLKLF